MTFPRRHPAPFVAARPKETILPFIPFLPDPFKQWRCNFYEGTSGLARGKTGKRDGWPSAGMGRDRGGGEHFDRLEKLQFAKQNPLLWGCQRK